jgi:hypothetical protein
MDTVAGAMSNLATLKRLASRPGMALSETLKRMKTTLVWAIDTR